MERILLAVEAVPVGRIASYGDIASVVGTGPRIVGAAMSSYGHEVAWWRITRADGSLPVHLLSAAREHWAAEGTSHAPDRVRIAEHRVDTVALARAYRASLPPELAETPQ